MNGIPICWPVEAETYKVDCTPIAVVQLAGGDDQFSLGQTQILKERKEMSHMRLVLARVFT